MGGLVGSLGYDYIRYTEKLPDDNPDEIGIETIQLMLASRFIAIDHEAETFTAVVLDEDNEAGRKRAMEEAEQLIRQARTGIDKYHDEKVNMDLDGHILKNQTRLMNIAKRLKR